MWIREMKNLLRTPAVIIMIVCYFICAPFLWGMIWFISIFDEDAIKDAQYLNPFKSEFWKLSGEMISGKEGIWI